MIKKSNGNTIVRLFDDGTRFITVMNGYKPCFSYPNNIDINISNRCYNRCKWCYIDANPDGDIANFETVIQSDIFKIGNCSKGIEIALNFNDFDIITPNFIMFLDYLKGLGYIVNATINESILTKENTLKLSKLQDLRLINAIGISGNKFNFDTSQLKNCVYHVVLGVGQLEKFIKSKFNDSKVVILGFKTLGRGKTFKPKNDKQLINCIRSKVVAFDTLAVQQLNLNTNTVHYSGNDTQSLYIDFVKMKFGRSSITGATADITSGDNVASMFLRVQNENS